MGNNDLENLHRYFDRQNLLTNLTDQSTPIHKQFYQSLDNDTSRQLEKIYHCFLRNHILTDLEEDMVYQTYPTFRVHLPGNIAVFDWHRDSDFNHSPHEVNVFLPITNAYDTNTFYYESKPFKSDFKPMNCDYGEFVIWDGANCKHGNKENLTGRTRVSFDFRYMRHSDYLKEKPKTSLSKKAEMVIGEYFEIMEFSPAYAY
jgi:hypothetical protein